MNAPPSRRLAGFTLIELMVTVAIAAVLLVVAAPSFVNFQRNSELTSATNSFVAAVNAARGEAMKRGMNAMLVPATGADWSSGWTVFVDQDRSGTLNTGDFTVIQQPALASYFSATGQGTASETPAYIMFDASGYAKTKTAGFGALTMTIARNDLSGAALSEQTRRIVIAKSGRARACKPATDTTCTASADE
ncbi:type IV fimbrial biogenesis protein FimT [Variovorax sp. OAS795]|uniref:GspH/FimT family pseudopilin n=1 Tax=Variovorax sp. OAS795 TaxID=3034231 RepID=UPI003398E6CE